MHSATEAALRKLDLIDFIPDSEGKTQIRIFQGRRVVVDDNLPVRAGTTDGLVYTTYLFGPGAFAKGAAALDAEPLQGGFGTEGVEIGASAVGQRQRSDQPASLHPASARGEVHFRIGGGGFADERGIGNGRELDAGLGKQKRPHRGDRPQQLSGAARAR